MAPVNDTTRFICLFHDANRARAAVQALEGLDGITPGSIRTQGNSETSTGTTGAQTLTDLGVPERDVNHLQDGLDRGGVLVSLDAPESRSGEIEKIFHHYSADKVDETEVRTEPEGLLAAGSGRGATAAETVIPVAQEELLVGKRDVDRGGVRVYRRTVEEPVREDVSLHEERVILERRTVDRPVTDADVRAGTQEIELVETAEVPVVQKVARVVEEVRVGKVESDRTEVIEDTVRHTEVDVEPVQSDLRTDGRLRD